MKTMDLILVIVAVLLIAFTVCMIVMYATTGGIPDTLGTCVFSACAWIKTTKERREDRRWQRQDRKEEMKYGKGHDE